MQRIQGKRTLTPEPSGSKYYPLPDLGGAAVKREAIRAQRRANRALPLVPIFKGSRTRTSGDPMADNAPADSGITEQPSAAAITEVIRPPRQMTP